MHSTGSTWEDMFFLSFGDSEVGLLAGRAMFYLVINHTMHRLGEKTGDFTMSLSPGNWVHSYEDSRRCELSFTNGWTAGQAVSEDRSPCRKLAVSPSRSPHSGGGRTGAQGPRLPLRPARCMQTASSLGFATAWKTNQVLL